MDRICISGISTFGYHGVLDHERRFGQRFTVDVVLDVDVAAAAAGDDLDSTVDYAGVVAAAVQIMEGQPVNLIETLAERIAARCLEDRRVDRAEITVHKPQAPVGARVADVTVTVVRDR
ncbi:MAG: dihydroneopterin aldolase [Nitriliruptoraceae bacterium]